MRIRNIAIPYSSTAVLVLLIAIAAVAPMLKQQVVTGIIVNATLFIGVYYLSTSQALLLAVIPSAMALAVGLLPPVLAPMVPFIILGNCMMVLVFSYMRKINYWMGGAVSAILKFAFLYGMSFVVTGLVLNKQVAASAASMMGAIQLFTALGGLILAYGVTRLAGRR
jgi:hypothetical protein